MPLGPRDIALLALKDRSGNVTARLESLLAAEGLPRVDAALARELTLGVFRRRATLQAVLAAYLDRPSRPPGLVWEILLLGAYQLLFLSRVPDFAVVNEAVEQAGRYHHKRQKGLVNAVLRTICRSMSELQAGRAPPAPDIVPVDWASHRKLSKPVFADPGTDPAAYLAGAYSLPKQIAERWIGQFGSLEAAVDVAAHANTRPPLILRVNSRRSSPAEVIAELSQEGLEAAAHANGLSVVLSGHADLQQLGVFQKGLVQPQDAAATAVALAAEAEPGMKILDFCAAPGTKTTHLAELIDDQGEIVAVDVTEEKLNRIAENCARLGLRCVRTVLAEQIGSLPLRAFDRVLADVPCSNTGVLARRAEARWRFRVEALERLTADQRHLVSAAAEYLRPGGRLIYSTCSLEPEEGPDVMRWLRARKEGLRLVREELMVPAGADSPTDWRDGGYLAVLEAKG